LFVALKFPEEERELPERHYFSWQFDVSASAESLEARRLDPIVP
jgi:hypothetical protein